MMGHRTLHMTGAEYDVVYGRRWYCFTQRPGVTAGVKRQMRRRERRDAKASATDGW